MAPVYAFASRPHYAAHIVPITKVLEQRGVDVVRLQPGRTPPFGAHVIVASNVDVQTLGGRRLIYVEHGAGQTYRGDPDTVKKPGYPGGREQDRVELFLCPNREVADLWADTYPTATVAVVGCPMLDRWHPPGPPPNQPRIAVTFHWPSVFSVESGTAWGVYARAVERLVPLALEHGWSLVGHNHPRWDRQQIGAFWEMAGIPQVDYRTVMDTATLLVADNCVAPDTPVLCADLRWRAAGDIKVGDRVIACDEEATKPTVINGRPGSREDRRVRTATVLRNYRKVLPCFEIETTHGTLTVTHEHPWLVRSRRPYHYTVKGRRAGVRYPRTGHSETWEWAKSDALNVGDRVAHLVTPWTDNRTYTAGWLAGMFDGEGCVHLRKGKTKDSARGLAVSIAQNPGQTLDKILAALDTFGVEHTRNVVSGKRCHKVHLRGGNFKMIAFLAAIGADRLVRKIVDAEAWDGWTLNAHVEQAEVLRITDVGEREVAVMSTSERTFVAGGFVAHNTSMLPEFASLGRPVLWLNSPDWRRDVHHGGRFWEWPEGQVVCDDPSRLIPTLLDAMLDPPAVRAARTAMVNRIYGPCDGQASERAADAIENLLADA